jgi:hypothetical protein
MFSSFKAQVHNNFPESLTSFDSKVKPTNNHNLGLPHLVRNIRYPFRNCKVNCWFSYVDVFLGTFVELQYATVSFVMSVRPSAWNKSGPTARTFMKLYVFLYFKNLSRKFKFH